MSPRPTPFDLVFASLAEARFPAIRDSLQRSGVDVDDPDAFVLDREVAQLLRELVPEDAPGGALAQHLTLLHHAFLFWCAGRPTFRLSRAAVQALVGAAEMAGPSGAGLPPACYIQFPEHLIWARLAPDEPPEPLDGMFLRPKATGFFILGIFGLHSGRDGFSVVDVEGYPPEVLDRDDGSAPFSPVLAGGAPAGIFSLVGEEEFLELAARSLARVAAVSIEGRSLTEVIEIG